MEEAQHRARHVGVGAAEERPVVLRGRTDGLGNLRQGIGKEIVLQGDRFPLVAPGLESDLIDRIGQQIEGGGLGHRRAAGMGQFQGFDRCLGPGMNHIGDKGGKGADRAVGADDEIAPDLVGGQGRDRRVIDAPLPGAALDHESAFVGIAVLPEKIDLVFRRAPGRERRRIDRRQGGRLHRAHPGRGPDRTVALLGPDLIAVNLPRADGSIADAGGIGRQQSAQIGEIAAAHPLAALHPEGGFRTGFVGPGEIDAIGMHGHGDQPGRRRRPEGRARSQDRRTPRAVGRALGGETIGIGGPRQQAAVVMFENLDLMLIVLLNFRQGERPVVDSQIVDAAGEVVLVVIPLAADGHGGAAAVVADGGVGPDQRAVAIELDADAGLEAEGQMLPGIEESGLTGIDGAGAVAHIPVGAVQGQPPVAAGVVGAEQVFVTAAVDRRIDPGLEGDAGTGRGLVDNQRRRYIVVAAVEHPGAVILAVAGGYGAAVGTTVTTVAGIVPDFPRRTVPEGLVHPVQQQKIGHAPRLDRNLRGEFIVLVTVGATAETARDNEAVLVEGAVIPGQADFRFGEADRVKTRRGPGGRGRGRAQDPGALPDGTVGFFRAHPVAVGGILADRVIDVALAVGGQFRQQRELAILVAVGAETGTAFQTVAGFRGGVIAPGQVDAGRLARGQGQGGGRRRRHGGGGHGGGSARPGASAGLFRPQPVMVGSAGSQAGLGMGELAIIAGGDLIGGKGAAVDRHLVDPPGEVILAVTPLAADGDVGVAGIVGDRCIGPDQRAVAVKLDADARLEGDDQMLPGVEGRGLPGIGRAAAVDDVPVGAVQAESPVAAAVVGADDVFVAVAVDRRIDPGLEGD